MYLYGLWFRGLGVYLLGEISELKYGVIPYLVVLFILDHETIIIVCTSTCRASTHIRNDTPHSHPPPPKSPTETTCLHTDPSRFTSVPVSGLRQHSPRSVVHERDVGLVPRGHDRQQCHRVPRTLPASRHVCMWVVRQGYPDVASFECVCNVSNDKSGNFLFLIFAIFSVELGYCIYTHSHPQVHTPVHPQAAKVLLQTATSSLQSQTSPFDIDTDLMTQNIRGALQVDNPALTKEQASKSAGELVESVVG